MCDLVIGEGFVLAPVHVDFGVGKIGESAAVVEVHVGEDDVLHVFGFISHPLDLVNRRLLRVERHDGDDAEELCEPGWAGVIFEAEAGIHERESLGCFDE